MKSASSPEQAAKSIEEALAKASGGPQGKVFYSLTLYISGATERSQRAVANVKRMCEQYLAGHYELNVIDLFQQPEAAREAQVVAAPTLIKKLPPPLCRFIGDLTNTERVLVRLELRGES